MSRAIDADALIEKITYLWDLNTVNNFDSNTVIRQIIQDVKEMPIIDTSEIYENRIRKLAEINEEIFRIVTEQNKRIRELEQEHTYRRMEKV